MRIKQPIPQQDYKVLVRCFTYNHSRFITQTLEGFVIQQTNFPFACVIVDDCSTDGEQVVIKDWIKNNSSKAPALYKETYADIYVVGHKDNSNCTMVFYLLKENHKSKQKKKSPYISVWKRSSKYCALCEGDDYWIDPMKLQVQADFLDSHLDYSAVATQSLVIYESGEPSRPFSKHKKDFDWDVGTLIGDRPFHTATIMYRPFDELDNRPKVYSGDVSVMIILSQKGKIKLLSRNTSIYRKHAGGASSNVKISDLMRDLEGIPYYLSLNPHFPKRKYEAYLNYTFSIFPPHNSIYNIVTYGIKSIYLNLTSYPLNVIQILKTIYYMLLKLLKKLSK